jgi:glutamate N-acetyltransferase / amino-acid N-acetyltransferase
MFKFNEDIALGPKGVWAESIACGIKKSGKKDLTLIATTKGCAIAGVFTPNKLAAAPVRFSQNNLNNLGYSQGRAIVVSSGNANAATGEVGYSSVVGVCSKLAKNLGCDLADILIAQTGLIGVFQKEEPINTGLSELSNKFLSSETSINSSVTLKEWEEAARGMMTTDTFPKIKAIELNSPEIINFFGESITLLGIAKGVAMHSPALATMISVIVTDANIEKSTLHNLLKNAVDSTFNCVNIDGCMSTNDTVFGLASSVVGGKALTLDEISPYSELEAGFKFVARELAVLMAKDAEGGRKFIRVLVEGGESSKSAQKIAKQIAGSVLVKCAIAGGCPYWGRVFAEVGASLEKVTAEKINIYFGPHLLCKEGIAATYDSQAVNDYLRGKEILIRVTLSEGEGVGEAFGSDLTHEYVDINMDKS